MELLKIVQKIQHTEDVLDIIIKEGLNADFIYIYNELKSDRCLIDFMPNMIFKYIEDVAKSDLTTRREYYENSSKYNTR